MEMLYSMTGLPGLPDSGEKGYYPRLNLHDKEKRTMEKNDEDDDFAVSDSYSDKSKEQECENEWLVNSEEEDFNPDKRSPLRCLYRRKD
jgi:hypothetical protein